MKIVVIGDSNAYGFDPYNGRYLNPWPKLLSEYINKEVINHGMNGMMISHVNPDTLYGIDKHDLILIQLGTNDILNGFFMDYIEKKLDKMIDIFKEYTVIYLIPKDVKGFPSLVNLFQSKSMDTINLNEWDIDLSYDGIHFTERGHEQLAKFIYTHILGYVTIKYEQD
ncbi:MAG: hypothetical protein HUJ53_01860 [Holdemanella sp.]|nr:hypothetical protein [Holdemanella sp.]